MTTIFTEKEIETIKSTYQSELEAYTALKKEISSLLEIPNLQKWNKKILNKRFCDFLTENTAWNIWKNSYGIYEMHPLKFVDRHMYGINFQGSNGNRYTTTITDDENRIDIDKFKSLIQTRIDSIESSIEKLKGFDVEKACQSANEIQNIKKKYKVPTLYMVTYEQNPLAGRLFAVMKEVY